MLNKLKKLKTEQSSQGFTIIEVMIVLAIAGLIILIVLLAVPALQRNGRNTSLKSDVGAVSGSVNEFTANNDGALPTAAGTTFGAGTLVLNNATGTPSTVKIQGSTTTVTAGADNTNATVTPLTGTLYIGFNDKCGVLGGTAAAPTYTVIANKRSTAIVYVLETSGNKIAKCQDT